MNLLNGGVSLIRLLHIENAIQLYRGSLLFWDGVPGNDQSTRRIQYVAVLQNAGFAALKLKDYSACTEFAEQVLEIQSGDPRALYLIFNSQLAAGNISDAVNALNMIKQTEVNNIDVDSNSTNKRNVTKGILCLAITDAFNCGSKLAAALVLEQLYRYELSEKTEKIDVSIIRILIRLKADTNVEIQKRSVILGEILDVINRLVDTLRSTNSLLDHDDATWFSKISWNLALEASQLGNSRIAAGLFASCDSFSTGVDSPLSNESKHMCTLMRVIAAADALEKLGPCTTETNNQREALESDARKAVVQYRRQVEASSSGPDPRLECMLVQFEFTTIVYSRDHLNKVALQFLQNTKDHANFVVPYNFFQSLSRIATAASRPEVALAALELAFETFISFEYLEAARNNESAATLAVLFRNIIEVMHTLLPETFEKIIQLIHRICSQDWFPNEPKANSQAFDTSLDIKWVITTVYNAGIHQYSCGSHRSAIGLIGAAMRLLEKLSVEVKEELLSVMTKGFDTVCEADTRCSREEPGTKETISVSV